jgi:hypothetical protein
MTNSTVRRGQRYAIPVDRIHEPTTFLNRDLWRQDAQCRVMRPGARMSAPAWNWVPKAWGVADRITAGRATQLRNMVAFGHDVHVTNWGNLYGRHFHVGWANPFRPDAFDAPLDASFETLFLTHWVDHACDLPVCPSSWGTFDKVLRDLSSVIGFTEDLGWLCGAKVTTAFVSEEIDELVSTTGTEYADFDFHEVGTSSAAEANTQTALTTTTSIARATGTPTDADPIYRSVGTITADTTETWAEHGIFNNSTGPAMMDRSLTGGQSVNNLDQVQYTYELTKNAEA